MWDFYYFNDEYLFERYRKLLDEKKLIPWLQKYGDELKSDLENIYGANRFIFQIEKGEKEDKIHAEINGIVGLDFTII